MQEKRSLSIVLTEAFPVSDGRYRLCTRCRGKNVISIVGNEYPERYLMKKITSAELDGMKIAELRVLGAELKLEGADTLKKPVLRQAIKDHLASLEEKKAVKEKTSVTEEADAAADKPVRKARTTRKTAEKTSGRKTAKKTDAADEEKKTVKRSYKTERTVKTEKTHKKDEQPELSDEQQQYEETADLQTPAPGEVKTDDTSQNVSDEAANGNNVSESTDAGHAERSEHEHRHERHDHRTDHRTERNEQKYSEEERPVVTGILDIAEGGFGFLRFDNFLTSDKDIYVSPTQIRRFNLKKGDKIKGITRRPNEGERFGALLYVNTVNGDEPGVSMRRPNFEDLTPIFPYERLRLEHSRTDLATRIIDLVAPIGKGQRGLIVAPPKTGKTVLLKKIATTIEQNYPDIKVIVLLVDERPEEVTDMKESINGDVLYSTFDEQAEHHVKVAEMVLAHAERLAEHKKDVVILLDSITRLARAYNMVIPSSGKTLSGGIDPGALHKPKKFFGAARKLREGGSITILATALIETGSRMDDVIFEEFKGTGNMELHLDRRLSEKRIFPAINLNKSGTRREDLLLDQTEMEAIWKIRRAMANQNPQEVTESIIDNLSKTRCNADFIEIILKTKVLG